MACEFQSVESKTVSKGGDAIKDKMESFHQCDFPKNCL